MGKFAFSEVDETGLFLVTFTLWIFRKLVDDFAEIAQACIDFASFF